MHRQREATTALIADQGGWISEKPTDRFRPIFRDPAAPDPSQATVFAFLSRKFFGELHPRTRISKSDEDLSMLRTTEIAGTTLPERVDAHAVALRRRSATAPVGAPAKSRRSTPSPGNDRQWPDARCRSRSDRSPARSRACS